MTPALTLALLAWHKDGGDPSWIGLAATVAYLLHGTLETMGLSPGPRDQFLGRQSAAALERWDSRFRVGAIYMTLGDVGPKMAEDLVMESFGQAPSPEPEETRTDSTRSGSAIPSRSGGVRRNYECLKASWSDLTPFCPGWDNSDCRWVLDLHNTCGHAVIVHFLSKLPGHPPLWEDAILGLRLFDGQSLRRLPAQACC